MADSYGMKRVPNGKPLVEVLGAVMPAMIRVTQFQAVSFYDQEQKRQVVLLYSLGVDGIIREYNGGANTWREYPVTTK